MHSYTKVLDISLQLHSHTLLYPGDPSIIIEPPEFDSPLPRLSQITFGSHTGSHVDAPSHYVENGISLDKLGLEHFVGPCRVLDMTACSQAVTRADLEPYAIKAGERVLLKTKNSQNQYETFRTDYVCLDPDAATYLAELGVALIGMDYLSIEQKGLPDNAAHLAFLEKNIPILESIVLKDVEPGEYFLSALPLAFTGIDGSPVRAVLLQ